MESESDEKITVNFKKFKVHHRKFPWALIIRAFVALVSIGLIFFLIQYLDEVKERNKVEEPAFEIEYEF